MNPFSGDITVRHVLTHTTGLPNWRPDGQPLEPLRPPGLRWGYSGEGFVLLQGHLEGRTGVPIATLAGAGSSDPSAWIKAVWPILNPAFTATGRF